jgi:hypothetical protein
VRLKGVAGDMAKRMSTDMSIEALHIQYFFVTLAYFFVSGILLKI